MSYPDCSFDSVGSFTMLHHVPTTALQNQILAEALRVLRPGGVLVGSDSLPSDGLHAFHEGDTCHPVEPSALLVRLQTLGFARGHGRRGRGADVHRPQGRPGPRDPARAEHGVRLR